MQYLPFNLCQIIDGKRFDTGNAQELGYYREGHLSDFNFIEEALLQTWKTKKFFLAGRGGAKTRYAEDLGSGEGRCRGKRIFPLTDKEAFAWAQENLGTDEVEEIFGDMIEDA